MLNQLTRVLDDLKIKYNIDESTDNINLVQISYNLNEDNEIPDILDLFLILPKNEERPANLAIIGFEIFKIPPTQREKIKNFVLDYESRTYLGSFAIRKFNKNVEFSCTLLLNYLKDGQALEIKRINKYLSIIVNNIKELRSELNKLIEDTNSQE